MSQITQYIKQVEVLEAKYQETIHGNVAVLLSLSPSSDLSKWEDIALKYAEVTKFHEELLQLQDDTGKKISEKLNQVDPVTGAKRYGLQTQQKFLSSHEKLEAVSGQFLPLYQQLLPHYNSLHDSYLQFQNNQLEVMKQLDAEKALSDEQKFQELQKQIEEEERRRKQKEQEHEEKMHEHAEIVRKRKLEESQSSLSLISEMEQTLQSKIQQLNDQLFYRKDLIPTYTRLVKNHCQEHPQQYPLRSVTSMVLNNIFDRVIAKPDDVNARRLRVNHPVLQSKLTGVRGSIQLLIICGFRLVLKPHSPGAPSVSSSTSGGGNTTAKTEAVEKEEKVYITPENKASYQQAIHQLSQATLEADLVPVFSPLLHPQSRWELFLEMEEPSIEDLTSLTATTSSSSEGLNPQEKKLSWIEWYDALKEYAESVKKELLLS